MKDSFEGKPDGQSCIQDFGPIAVNWALHAQKARRPLEVSFNGSRICPMYSLDFRAIPKAPKLKNGFDAMWLPFIRSASTNCRILCTVF